jgi:molecular chaperone GrpE
MSAGEKNELEALTSERNELRDRLLRSAADFDNYRKRVHRDIEANAFEERARIFRAFLPIVDNLERALEHALDNDPVGVGVRLVHQQLLSMLEKEGVTRFSPIGELFDPARQEAIDQIETVEMPPGTVANVLVPGYLLNGRLLRAAVVTVSKRPVADDTAQPRE